MSASLIGRLGSSAFRLSTSTVSMSLTGSCPFSNRPFGVKRFQTIHQHSIDVAHGLVLLGTFVWRTPALGRNGRAAGGAVEGGGEAVDRETGRPGDKEKSGRGTVLLLGFLPSSLPVSLSGYCRCRSNIPLTVW